MEALDSTPATPKVVIKPINRHRLQRATPTHTKRVPSGLKAGTPLDGSLREAKLVDIKPRDPSEKIHRFEPINHPRGDLRPLRGETWGELIARVGDENHGTAIVEMEDGTIEERPITLKEALVRRAYKMSMEGNAKVMIEVLRRMPNPHTGLSEGDPPSIIQTSDWRTTAIKLIADGKITPQRAVQAFGIDLAAQLFNIAGLPFTRRGNEIVVIENAASGQIPQER